MIISHKESSKQQSDTIAIALQKDLKSQVAKLRMQLKLLQSLNNYLSNTVATMNNAADAYFKATKLMFKLTQSMSALIKTSIDYSRTSLGSYNAIMNFSLPEAL